MSAFGKGYAPAVRSCPVRPLAIWFIDVRNFRSVNPKFGYSGGNLVLRTIAECIKECIAHDLPVARIGGDRFVTLSAGVRPEAANDELAKVSALVEERIAAEGIVHPIVLAGGVYYLREADFDDPVMQRTLDYASIAHRNAHHSQLSNVSIFSDEDLERDMRRITIEQSIDRALAEGQIEVWYQPQVDYTHGEVVGAEALSRWHHPTLGWIGPREFIPVLEACGKIHDLDLFVWEEACRNAGRWRSFSDGKPVPISVNVSRSEMYEPGLMEHFLELQRKYDLPEGSLHLEVTENAFVEDADRLYTVIENMRSHKMMVEMDDFGSGLSSLNMLKDVPVDMVKLDMGFIRSAVGEERGGVVLGAVIRMLQGLDTPIIAEGVETLEQAEMLKNMGCHLMQGYHFSRPMPCEEFESFVAGNRTVERTNLRERQESGLDDLLALDTTTSYLFNHVLGGIIFFFISGGTVESILVNDKFYEECGLRRKQFGSAKVNPLEEIDEESRETMWRAAAEAREYGAAPCHAKVRLTNRWIDGVIRFVGESARGDIFSLSIMRSSELSEGDGERRQLVQDSAWYVSMLDTIAPNGFIKCAMTEGLPIVYLSPSLYRAAGVAKEEFAKLFHDSLMEVIWAEDRQLVLDATSESSKSGAPFGLPVRMRYGYGSELKTVRLAGRVHEDEAGTWLYGFVFVMGDAVAGEPEDELRQAADVTSFDYMVEEDRLVIRDEQRGDFEIEHWLRDIESHPELIARTSAVKLLSSMRDLRHHPTSGFIDVKCDLRGGKDLKWYHVDYTCEANDAGDTVVVHGYARGASDQRGSARWWRLQAQTDQLTGLLNRSAVEEEINVGMRTQGKGMMFMVDLDGFKRVNDELGHLVGDELLRGVARALESSFRGGDIVGRYGGDEFVAFVPYLGDDPKAFAARRAARIIDAISKVTAGDNSHVACSVGVAICSDREATFYDLLEVADTAMYESKEAGKGTYTIVTMGQADG